MIFVFTSQVLLYVSSLARSFYCKRTALFNVDIWVRMNIAKSVLFIAHVVTPHIFFSFARDP